MTLETIYFIGQTIAAAAVVASLLIVAFQLHQANRQSAVNMALEIAAAADRSFDPIYQDDNISIWTRGLAGDPDMTDAEKLAFDLFMARVTHNGVQIAFSIKRRLYQKQDALRFAFKVYHQIVSTPGGKSWCDANDHMLSAEFIELTEAAATADEHRMET
ncbi:MAG: hypothetical protein AAF996_08830 [Pseudomonadota bacterium]